MIDLGIVADGVWQLCKNTNYTPEIIKPSVHLYVKLLHVEYHAEMWFTVGLEKVKKKLSKWKRDGLRHQWEKLCQGTSVIRLMNILPHFSVCMYV